MVVTLSLPYDIFSLTLWNSPAHSPLLFWKETDAKRRRWCVLLFCTFLHLFSAISINIFISVYLVMNEFMSLS